ncbi:hypothetical protein DFQ28_005491 [Apophysomyces sp. BC1034]|nr:hypothetical protein DFQ30_005313 [Apophysomyces sp. BC1015]KAG0177834.1 hypothetical protein DFQ29_004280 [Apophysomyces sp. BC1021]KAG0188023.1 hypothetical protein DFQ28_005491 [Apophysomyces sp. BC1034]
MSDKIQIQSDVDNMAQDMKKTMEQTSSSTPPRRRSLWENLRSGSLLASDRDIRGSSTMDATGFSTTAAKFEDMFGVSALTETGFKYLPGRDENARRRRSELSEDALRQMS